MNKKCQKKDCNKKLSIIQQSMICKCKHYFCNNHRFYTNHNCSYVDEVNKEEIIENMKCIKDKIIKIN